MSPQVITDMLMDALLSAIMHSVSDDTFRAFSAVLTPVIISCPNVSKGTHLLEDVHIRLHRHYAICGVPGLHRIVIGQRGVVHSISCLLQEPLHTLHSLQEMFFLPNDFRTLRVPDVRSQMP